LPPTNLSCKKRVFVCYLFTRGSASILILQFTSAIRHVHGIISEVYIIHIEAFIARAWGRASADDVTASSKPARPFSARCCSKFRTVAGIYNDSLSASTAALTTAFSVSILIAISASLIRLCAAAASTSITRAPHAKALAWLAASFDRLDPRGGP
jgi:hypothetical protein